MSIVSNNTQLTQWVRMEPYLASRIAAHLGIENLITSCFSVCKDWYKCLNNDSIWQNLVSRISIGSIPRLIGKILNSSPLVWPRKRVYEPYLMSQMTCPALLHGTISGDTQRRPDLWLTGARAANWEDMEKNLEEECGEYARTICAKQENNPTALGKAFGVILTILKGGRFPEKFRDAAVGIAARLGNVETVRILVKGGPVSMQSYGLALKTAYAQGCVDIVDSIFDAVDPSSHASLISHMNEPLAANKNRSF